MLNAYWWNNLLAAFAEGAPAATGEQPAASSGFDPSMIIMIVAMIAIFYFLMIRPQRKKDKKVKDMLGALKVGDRICTIGGIYGTVVQLRDDSVTLAVGAQKTQLVMARWSIRSVEDAAVENDAEPQV